MILIFVAQKACRPSLSMGSISLIFFWPNLESFKVNNLVPSNDFGFLYCHNPISPYRNSFAIGAAVFMTEVSPKVLRSLQPAIELLVGIPSVVYGFIGFAGRSSICPYCLWWNWFWDFVRDFVLFVMILPTVTFMTTDSLRAVPRHYREASLAMGPLVGKPSGACTLKAARSGFYGSCLWDGACLW